MSVQYPYRAVICGQEHIITGWREGNLVTKEGEFAISPFFPNNDVFFGRILEVAMLQLDNGEWLLNGHNLRSLQSMKPTGFRFNSITEGEVLRVHKEEICAIAWGNINGEEKITEMLDQILSFWKTASQPVKTPDKEETLAGLFRNANLDLHYMRVFAGWSEPIWLKEFHTTVTTNPKSTGLEIASAQPANVPVESVKPIKNKAIKVRQPKLVARFEDDFSIAVIPKKGGTEILLTIENELRLLIKKIITAGGKQPRTKLRSNKLDTYQPEKLLKSKVAKSLIKARLLGTSKSGRTTVFWAKQRAG